MPGWVAIERQQCSIYHFCVDWCFVFSFFFLFYYLVRPIILCGGSLQLWVIAGKRKHCPAKRTRISLPPLTYEKWRWPLLSGLAADFWGVCYCILCLQIEGLARSMSKSSTDHTSDRIVAKTYKDKPLERGWMHCILADIKRLAGCSFYGMPCQVSKPSTHHSFHCIVK